MISQLSSLHQRKKIAGLQCWLKIDFQPLWIASFVHNSELYLWDICLSLSPPQPLNFLVMDGQTEMKSLKVMRWKPTGESR